MYIKKPFETNFNIVYYQQMFDSTPVLDISFSGVAENLGAERNHVEKMFKELCFKLHLVKNM